MMKYSDVLDYAKGREELKAAYARSVKRRGAFLLLLFPLLVLFFLLAIASGSAEIGLADVWRSIASSLGIGAPVEASNQLIIWKLRMPRAVMGILAGAALGLSGAVMQVVLRNPLADPYMLGVSSAAGFGASLAIVLGVGFVEGQLLLIGNAFFFSLLSSTLILLLAGRRGGSPQTMVLTGLALLFFFQAMTTMIQYFGDSEAVKAAVFWTVGDLGKVNWLKVSVSALLVVPSSAYLISQGWNLNILNAGDADAKSLGLNVRALRIRCIIVSSLMIAAVVSFTGTIGFIGLVAPHIVRMIIGSDNRVLVPASGLVGALLLVLADTVARTVISPVILPVGAVTAFMGVPLFLYLIMKRGDLF